ncbi:hypothetical protein SBADM41S_06669 [Streptomyces badius]
MELGSERVVVTERPTAGDPFSGLTVRDTGDAVEHSQRIALALYKSERLSARHLRPDTGDTGGLGKDQTQSSVAQPVSLESLRYSRCGASRSGLPQARSRMIPSRRLWLSTAVLAG